MGVAEADEQEQISPVPPKISVANDTRRSTWYSTVLVLAQVKHYSYEYFVHDLSTTCTSRSTVGVVWAALPRYSRLDKLLTRRVLVQHYNAAGGVCVLTSTTVVGVRVLYCTCMRAVVSARSKHCTSTSLVQT